MMFKPLIFQTFIFWPNRIYSLKYLRSTILTCKIIRIRKSEFVGKTQFLYIIHSLEVAFWAITLLGSWFFGKCTVWKYTTWDIVAWEIENLGICRLRNWTFGNMSLEKLNIWEYVAWEMPLGICKSLWWRNSLKEK